MSSLACTKDSELGVRPRVLQHLTLCLETLIVDLCFNTRKSRFPGLKIPSKYSTSFEKGDQGPCLYYKNAGRQKDPRTTVHMSRVSSLSGRILACLVAKGVYEGAAGFQALEHGCRRRVLPHAKQLKLPFSSNLDERVWPSGLPQELLFFWRV